MIIELIVPAIYLDDGETCYKPTGHMPYIFRKELVVYTAWRKKGSWGDPNCFYLHRGGYVNEIKRTDNLKLMFKSVEESKAFLDKLQLKIVTGDAKEIPKRRTRRKA